MGCLRPAGCIGNWAAELVRFSDGPPGRKERIGPAIAQRLPTDCRPIAEESPRRMTSLLFGSYHGLKGVACSSTHLPATGRKRKGLAMEANAVHAPDESGNQGDALSPRDLKILEFERQWWKYAGAKEQAMREMFDMSATRYYQALNALIDRPAAVEADPMLVKRLRRLRAARQRARSARRLGIEA
jgi:hypothetical protein